MYRDTESPGVFRELEVGEKVTQHSYTLVRSLHSIMEVTEPLKNFNQGVPRIQVTRQLEEWKLF